MSELIGVSLDAPASPAIAFQRAGIGRHASSGWGLAWYPNDELVAASLRDPKSGESTSLDEVLHNWDTFRTGLLLGHLRRATLAASHRDTHPFVRMWGGGSWALAHDGDLHGDLQSSLPLPSEPVYQPSGPSDTEHFFSWLLAQAAKAGAADLGELGHRRLHELFTEVSELGTLSVIMSDGKDLVAHCDDHRTSPLWFTRLAPIGEHRELSAEGVSLVFGDDGDAGRTAVVVCSIPLHEEGWTELGPGETLVVSRGQVRHHFAADRGVADRTPWKGLISRPERPPSRTLEVTHETRYRYTEPVERSDHRFRLTPLADSFQQVHRHELSVDCDGTRFRFEDVFGNDVVGFDITTPYSEIVTTARSLVTVWEVDDRTELLPERGRLPLVWMPWQYQMMTPYLLPAELPENELRELGVFAQSFATRSRGDLLTALDDLTSTIYQDFQYKPGFTTLETTPYEVYTSRSGVCQDFANLMICACRLLQIPARYRVGYIYTGADYDNTMQSEASHAWVEVFLPYLGWRGYDPTNGCRVGSDHVRVAAGRNYRDATPTSGVIHRGGGGEETLEISVQVEQVEGD